MYIVRRNIVSGLIGEKKGYCPLLLLLCVCQKEIYNCQHMSLMYIMITRSARRCIQDYLQFFRQKIAAKRSWFCYPKYWRSPEKWGGEMWSVSCLKKVLGFGISPIIKVFCPREVKSLDSLSKLSKIVKSDFFEKL